MKITPQHNLMYTIVNHFQILDISNVQKLRFVVISLLGYQISITETYNHNLFILNFRL